MTTRINVNLSGFDAIALKQKADIDIQANRNRYVENERLKIAKEKGLKQRAIRTAQDRSLGVGSLPGANGNFLDQGYGGGGPRRWRPDELAASQTGNFADIIIMDLLWQTGVDYDLNVGFAESLTRLSGYRPVGASEQWAEDDPEFANYVGWTFNRFEAFNFMYHDGDIVSQGPAREYTLIDLTRDRVGLPSFAENFINFELRSYWYAEPSALPLTLTICPVKLGGEPAFDPEANFFLEYERLKQLGMAKSKSISFNLLYGTGEEAGDLGVLIATLEVDLNLKKWKLIKKIEGNLGQ